MKTMAAYISGHHYRTRRNYPAKCRVAVKYFNNKDSCITQDFKSGNTPNSFANITEGRSFTTAGFALLREYTDQNKNYDEYLGQTERQKLPT